MAECPKCHGAIEIGEANFGTLYTCPLCRGLFFVGWDGHPEVNDEVSDRPELSEASPASAPAVLPPALAPELPWASLDREFGDSVQPQSQASAIDEIERFANQNQETTPLTYDLSIGGLDLPVQIQVLREALEDPRFGWDSEQILSQINQGMLRLRNLSPIKTSILVHRIKSSDLEIEWRQNVLS